MDTEYDDVGIYDIYSNDWESWNLLASRLEEKAREYRLSAVDII